MRLIKLAIFLIPAALVAATQETSTPKTVWHGVYTAEQAARGAEAYQANCRPCHGAELEGINGSRLSGPEFMERWREYDVHALFDFVSRSMPQKRQGSPNSPGSLDQKTYIDIIAHILRANRFPEGKTELTSETLKTVQIEGQDGPKPLPTGALVQVVGCLEKRTPSGWSLTSATEPARTSISRNSTPEERKIAEAKALGMLRFRLASLDYIADVFNPDEHAGHKIQTKGYLIRQPNNERIDITSMEILAVSCER